MGAFGNLSKGAETGRRGSLFAILPHPGERGNPRVAAQPLDPRPEQRRPAELGAKLLLRRLQDPPQVETAPCGRGLKLRVLRRRGVAVPGADLLADVAAEQPAAELVLHFG